jgi:hypothetical protein
MGFIYKEIKSEKAKETIFIFGLILCVIVFSFLQRSQLSINDKNVEIAHIRH